MSAYLGADGSVSIVPADVYQSGTDNCGTVNLVSVVPSSFTCANIGPNPVILTVNDGHGNTATCSTTVTVVDNIPPVLTCHGMSAYLGADGSVSIVPADVYQSGTDNCGMVNLVAVDPYWYDCSDVGDNPAWLLVNDGNGNSAGCFATVTVVDSTHPTLICPQSIYHCIDSYLTGEAITGLTPVVFDNCGIYTLAYETSGEVSCIGLNDASGTFFPLGQSWVEYVVVDRNLNMSTCTFSVEVYAGPLAGASAVLQNLCQNEDFTLYGTAAGGSGAGYSYTWSGPDGFLSGAQNPAFASAQPAQSGLYSLVVTDSHQCQSTNDASVDVTVWPLPEVTFEGNIPGLCLDSDPILLSTGSPPGGAYSGSGVSGSYFYPALAGPGTHILTYSYTDGNGCTNYATNTAYVYNSMPQTVTVGIGGHYPTLTGKGGLFEALNTRALCNNLLVKIISNVTEPGTNALNQWLEDGNGPYTMTIVPDQAVQRNLTGNVALDMIRFNGADRVTIDGRVNGQGRYLLFRNLAAYNSTFTYINDASDHVLRNCYIEGSNRVTSGGVIQLSTGVSTGNDNFVITQNIIRQGSATNPNNLISSTSSATVVNSNIQITNNELSNFRSSGVYVSGTGAGTNFTIENNSFYYNLATAASLPQTVISFTPSVLSSNNVIRGNVIGGSNSSAGGTAWVNSGAVTFRGIYANAGTYKIENNVITNISQTSTGASSFTGIDLSVFQGSQSTVKGNTIGSATVANAISRAGTGNFTGILVNSTLPIQLIEGNVIANVTYNGALAASPVIAGIQANKAYLRKNKIHSLNANGALLTPTIYGVTFNGTAGTTNECSNNMISLGGGTAANPTIYGIYENSVANSYNNYYYNTVNIYGTASTTKSSYAFYRKNSTNVTLKNNLLTNQRVANPVGQYAIYTVSSTYWTYSNYNDLYTASAPLANWAGADKATMALWRTASGKDLNSQNVLPVFYSNTDLHLTVVNTLLDGKGTPVAGTTTDIDNQMRNATIPDIGCDEFTSAARMGEEIASGTYDLTVYPNPFSTTTTLEVTLSDDQNVEITVYNLMGEKIEAMVNGMLPRGTHTYTFGGNDLPAGMYLVRMVVEGEKTVVKRVQLVR